MSGAYPGGATWSVSLTNFVMQDPRAIASTDGSNDALDVFASSDAIPTTNVPDTTIP